MYIHLFSNKILHSECLFESWQRIVIVATYLLRITDLTVDLAIHANADDTWQNNMQRRTIHAEEFCADQKLLDKHDAAGNFWVAEETKILYCSVEKAGCSSTKLVLKYLNGGRFPEKVPPTKVLINNQFADYTKILFVREPVERLVSAFRYTTMKNLSRFASMIEEISRLYHTKNATASMKAHVTFEEFIKYVVEERQLKKLWCTIENLCQPCQINYDYIGKYETFTEDLANIIMKFRNRTFDDAKHFVPHAKSKSR